MLKEKDAALGPFLWLQYLNNQCCMINIMFCLCFFCFLPWASNRICVPSYFLWTMSSIMAMFPLSRVQLSAAEQGGCGCMTRSIGDKNKLNIIPSSKTKSDGDVISTFPEEQRDFQLYLACCSRRSPRWELSEKRFWLSENKNRPDLC